MQNDSRKKDHFQFPVGQWYIYRMISSSVTMSCLNLLQFWVEEMHGEELNPSDMAWAPYISINYQTALRRTTKKTLLMSEQETQLILLWESHTSEWGQTDFFGLAYCNLFGSCDNQQYYTLKHLIRDISIYLYVFFWNSKKGFFSSFPKALSFKSSITYVLILLDASFLHFSTCIVRMSNSAKLNLVSEKKLKGYPS